MAWKKRSFKNDDASKRPRKPKRNPEDATLIDVEVKAMHLLSIRDHSVAELTKKLKQRKYPQEHIDATIDRMCEFGYLDDERTCLGMTRMLINQRWGIYQVRNKLKLKGFQERHINQSLEELVEEDTWFEHASTRVRSKFRKEPEEMDKEEKQKAFRHLQYRGYGGDIIRRILF